MPRKRTDFGPLLVTKPTVRTSAPGPEKPRADKLDNRPDPAASAARPAGRPKPRHAVRNKAIEARDGMVLKVTVRLAPGYGERASHESEFYRR